MPEEQFSAIELTDYPLYERQLALYVYLLQQQHLGPVRGHLVLVNVAAEQRKTLVVDRMARRVKRGSCSRSAVSSPVTRHGWHEPPAAAVSCRQPSSSRFQACARIKDTMMEQIRLALQTAVVSYCRHRRAGKTVAALYPAVEYALREGLRLFFVTAKTTQQQLAVDTLQQMAQPGRPLTACICVPRRKLPE